MFPPFSTPPLRPNTNPRCNKFSPSPFPSTIVSTPLHRDAWAHYLSDYPDRAFVASILQIIESGANIGFSASETVRPCRNLKSALEQPAFVDSAVDLMVTNGQVHGPFLDAPLSSLRCSPLGTVSRKRNPSKLRIINHLSWPRGTSVNDGIPDSEASIKYDAFECAIRDLVASGPGSLMAKLDLKDAFRHIPIRPDDWHHLGFTWKRKLYYCVALTFGLRSAPYIFNLFAEALHWIIQRHIPAHLRHYLDDFFLVFHPSHSPSYASAAVEWVMALGKDLGLSFQDSKTVWPCTSIEFLGLELDSVSMEARLPTDKLTFLNELLSYWLKKRSASLVEVQELVGFLQFASQVIPRSRSFLRRLIDFSSKFRSQFVRLHLPASARRDLVWWKVFCEPWNGVRILSPAQPSVCLYTDASGRKGLGGIFGSEWYSSRVPRRFRDRDIQFKEAFAILRAILCWGDEWSGRHVLFYCDNQDVVIWLTSGTCRSRLAMPLVRLISMMAACLCFSYSCIWIPSAENSLADAASRFQYTRLFQLAPHLSRISSTQKSQLIGMKHTLSSLDGSVSTCGMGLHPALAKHIRLDNGLTSTSSGCAPNSFSALDSSSLPPPMAYSSGSPASVTEQFSPKQLKATSAAFVPFTLMPASLLKPVNHLQFKESYVVSSVSTENVHATLNCQSPLAYSVSSSKFPMTPSLLSMQHSALPSSLRGRASCAVENSLSHTQNRLVQPPTSLVHL